MAKDPNAPQDDDPITPLPGLSQACKTQLKTQRVAVVGGGFAGLAAGLRLSRHGVKVTVYEPHTEKQWGGRVRSDRAFADGRIIETGAELIGSFHTAWLRLAQQYGISMINRMSETEYEREGLNLKLRLDTAKDLTWPEVKKLNDKVEQVFKRFALEAGVVTQETCPWQESDANVRKQLQDWDKQSVADALRRIGVPPNSQLWTMLQLRLVNDEVAPLEEMNYLGLLCKVKGGQSKRFELHDPYPMGYWEELEIFRCADGCQSLADEMVAEVKKNGGSVAARTKVAEIDISADNVQLTIQKVKWTKPDKAPPEYELGPKEKVSDRFQYVVLAIPPSVWSDVVIRVDGSQQDLQAYVGGALGNGPAVKFFSGLRKRFWISEQATPSGGTMALGQIWEGTDNQTQAGAQGIVLSVFAGPVIPGKTKGSSRPPTRSEMQLELKKLYSGYDLNLIPGKTIYQDWPAEPFIKSGYWTPRPDGEIFRVGPKLNTPFPPSPPSHDRLYFAGEHTYPSFFGYMEGALRSGIRAANMLMSRVCGLKVYPCPPPPPDLRVASAGEAPQSNGLG
jgi:monoamine oxidase